MITSSRTAGVTSPPTIDFTEGRWGHRLHASTWHKVVPKPLTRWQKLSRLFRGAAPAQTEPRYRVLCHSNVRPWIGFHVVYWSDNGRSKAEILDVERFGDPDDMYAITVKVIES